MRNQLAAGSVMLTLFFASCNKGEKTEIDGPNADLITTACETHDRCPDVVGFRSKSECVAALEYTLTCGPVVEDALTIRELEVERANEDACIAWLQTVSCDGFDPLAFDSPCSPLFGPPATKSQLIEDANGLGDSCGNRPGGNTMGGSNNLPPVPDTSISEPCKSGLFCTGGEYTSTFSGHNCRTCQPSRVLGEECSNIDENTDNCGPGLYCDGTCKVLKMLVDDCKTHKDCGPFLNCRIGKCSEKPKVGEACQEGEPCDLVPPFFDGENLCFDGVCGVADYGACSAHQNCQSGYCPILAGEGYCRARDLDDEPEGSCYTDVQCLRGAEICNACQPDCNGLTRGSCVPIECGVDTECEDGEQCLNYRCRSVPECDGSYNCRRDEHCVDARCLPRPGPGDDCGANDRCLEPFVCKSGVCELADLECEPAAEDEDCAVFGVCIDGFYCDSDSEFICKPRRNIGESCKGVTTPRFAQWFDPCVDEAACIDQVCVSREPVPSRCADSELRDDSGLCVEKLQQGEMCRPGYPNEQCVGDLVCAGPESICQEEGACIDGAECLRDSRCDFTMLTPDGLGTCVPCMDAGEPGCGVSLGTPQPNGGRCVLDVECESGTCGRLGICVESLICIPI